MKAHKIRDNIYWVGAIDYKLRTFHGYSTEKGSSYNAFLIIDEKITLIDGVKKGFEKEMIDRISSVVDPAKIDVIISNHVEPDHSYGIFELTKIAKNAKVYSSFPSGVRGLEAHYGKQNIIGVKSGETMNIGKYNLQFVATPMVHWPDNMVTYLVEEKILFSNDAFGQHLATCERFDFEYDLDIALFEAEKYFANIVLPYASQVKRALEACKGLEINMIAPSHGLCWQKNIAEIMGLYNKMIEQDCNGDAVVVYDTMWGNSEAIAKAIAQGFIDAGQKVKLFDLQNNHISNVIQHVMNSKYLAVGSSTLNNNMLPTVAAFLCYLKGLAPKKKHFIAFGSYGWSGQSIDLVEKELEGMGHFKLADKIRFIYAPSKADLDKVAQSITSVLK